MMSTRSPGVDRERERLSAARSYLTIRVILAIVSHTDGRLT
jgi:hypothetical protein